MGNLKPFSSTLNDHSPRPDWRQALQGAVRDPDELLRLLGLPDTPRPGAIRAARQFPLMVPRGFVDRMRHGDPDDPLLRQVLPLDAEDDESPGFTQDPVADRKAMHVPGLLRKYRGRGLLITTGSCAVNCRYCFRRHFPYETTPRGLTAWQPAIDALREDRTLSEIILSGGDPLLLTDRSLDLLLRELEKISHLQRLRIHSRLPIVLPERVTRQFTERLRRGRLTPIVVVHANHAAELVGPCAKALQDVVDSGIPVLNQAVLLRGVNDTPHALAELCERLIALRVLPYYLHQLDPVRGAAHFHVSEARGRELIAELRKTLPGYAVPRYVKEVPDAASKLPIHDTP